MCVREVISSFPFSPFWVPMLLQALVLYALR
jgi:hypothetical protein